MVRHVNLTENVQTVDVRLVGARPNIHKAGQRTNHEAVVDDDVLLNAESPVAAFEVARAVAFDAMAQHQVLSAKGARIGSACRKPSLWRACFSVVGGKRLLAANRRRSSREISMPKSRPWRVRRPIVGCADRSARRERRLRGVSRLPPRFPQPDLWGSEYFQAYPSTDRDLGSIAMDHRALRHHSFTSSSGKEQSAIQQ